MSETNDKLQQSSLKKIAHLFSCHFSWGAFYPKHANKLVSTVSLFVIKTRALDVTMSVLVNEVASCVHPQY